MRTGGQWKYTGRPYVISRREVIARRTSYSFCITASSFPPEGSVKWKRRPPGKEKMGSVMRPRKLTILFSNRFEVFGVDDGQREFGAAFGRACAVQSAIQA